MATSSDTERSNGADGAGEAGRLSGVRQSAADAYESARERTRTAFASTRETVRGAGQRTADGIDANPVAAVIGGVALRAGLGALAPRSGRGKGPLRDAGPRGDRYAPPGLPPARRSRPQG